MKSARIRSFAMRHRRSIRDLTALFALALVGLFIAFEVDIFANEDKLTVHEETLELDEVLLLGGLLAVGLLGFAIRRYVEADSPPIGWKSSSLKAPSCTTWKLLGIFWANCARRVSR
jgi:hypothetical protein